MSDTALFDHLIERSLTCGECGYVDDQDSYDNLGACWGNVFCPSCNTEIDSGTGEPAIPCLKCAACNSTVEQFGED